MKTEKEIREMRKSAYQRLYLLNRENPLGQRFLSMKSPEQKICEKTIEIIEWVLDI